MPVYVYIDTRIHRYIYTYTHTTPPHTHTPHTHTHMSAIAPITGTLKRRAFLDIVVGFSIGGAMASYWWWGFHMNVINKREAFYAELAKKKQEEDA